MSGLIDGLKSKNSLTDNGALTNESSLSNILDLFFLAGASRNMSERDIIAMFSKAYAEDKIIALKLLFWARDIRGGAGERRFFRIIFKYLAEKDNRIFREILPYVDNYGRWDDLFFDEEILKYTKSFLREIISYKNILAPNTLGLLFKWLPREKSSKSKLAKIIRKELSLSKKEYRLLCSQNSDTVENLLSAKKFNEVEYKTVPSKAFNLYRNAFMRNDEKRFEEFLDKVEKGEEKVKAGAIFPVDIYKSYKNGGDRKSINAQWSNLPNFLEGNEENIMPVCDTSGSMTGEPMQVSISLGVYLSERMGGIFKDNFITFEGNPKLQSLKGDAVDRFEQIRRASSDCSTNIQAVFDLILDIAKRDNLKDSDLPSKLLIISDMEFNEAETGYFYNNKPKTNFEVIREKYQKAGYKMPGLIFWNVDGRIGNVPAQVEDKDVALVSGYSPSIVKSLLGGEDLSPLGVMMKTLNNKRYDFVDEIKEDS